MNKSAISGIASARFDHPEGIVIGRIYNVSVIVVYHSITILIYTILLIRDSHQHIT